MSDVGHWVESGERVRSLIPSVHMWALSPDDAWIAWTERQREREVHVTELSSWRTVTTLAGGSVVALRWTSPSTLIALRSAQRHATLHAYAIPDGGELSRSTLADVGFQGGEIDASADGRAMLIGALTRNGWLGAREAVREVYLVRGEFCDDVARIDPFDVAGPRSALPGWQGRCALSPDGHGIAVALSPAKPASGASSNEAEATMTFISLTTRAVRSYALLEAGNPTHLLWVSPTSVVAAFLDDQWSTGLHRVDEEGARALVTRLGRNERLRAGPSLKLHPDRARMLAVVERATDRQRMNVRSVAMVVGLPLGGAAQSEILGLSRDRGPSWRDRSGGACWDGEGRLLTLTQPRANEAQVSRRDAVLTPPHTLAQFAFPGETPHALSLSVSPRASLALAAWRVGLNDVGDTAKRIAIVSLT
ncbi:MAG: hypothetical protein U0326_18275 [Polyangiales bacterium]